MNRIAYLWIFLLVVLTGESLFSISLKVSEIILSTLNEQDTLKKNQNLYTGKVWLNKYRRFIGDQFLFCNYFLPGTVSTNGKTFKNLMIRYDIYSDEIMIPANLEEILQLNKEMIDSFSINFENKVFRFTKIQEGLENLNGYFHVLNKQKSVLLIKYKKEISTDITEKSDGEFIQTQKIYFIKDSAVYPIATKNDLRNALYPFNVQIENYLKNNKLKVSRKKPESFIPVIRYYDSISQ